MRVSFLPLLVFLLFGSALNAGAEGVSTPNAGELTLQLPNETGTANEPAKFHYAFAPNDEKLESETEVFANIVEALPDNSVEPHFLDVFVEDTPAGNAKGEQIVQRLRTLQKKLRPRYGKRIDRIQIGAIPVPPALAHADTQAIEFAAKRLEKIPGKATFGAELRKAMIRPVGSEIQTGVITGGFRGVTTFMTFMSAGVDPLRAASIGVVNLAVIGLGATFARPTSKILGLNLKIPGAAIRGKTLFWRRQGYNLILIELLRWVGGTPNGAAPIDSWMGQAQILTFALGTGALDALFSSMRDRAFLEDPVRFARVYLASYFLLTPWFMFEGAGTFHIIFDLAVLQVRASTIGMVIAYLGLSAAVGRYPKKTAEFVDAIFEPIEKGFGKVRRVFGDACRTVLRPASD